MEYKFFTESLLSETERSSTLETSVDTVAYLDRYSDDASAMDACSG